MIRFENVTKRYDGAREALKGVSFEINPGELAFLTGRSGAGKSTVLKLVALIEHPTRGTVTVDGRNLGKLPKRGIPAHRQQIGMVFQDNKLLGDRSAYENVALPLIINGTGSVAATASQHLASLAMSGNGQFSLTADDRLIRTGAFSSSGAASLDLRDGSLIVDYAGASPLAAVQAALTSGHASGAWNGSGIRSSTANASAIADAIGYAEASAIMTTPGTFAGETVDATTVVARYTLAGDANLNGTVNLDDFTSLAVGFGVASIWSSGDFTYDGAVNLGDFTALAANFGNTAPAGLPRTAGLPSTTTIAAVSPFGDKRIGEEILLIGAPGI